MTESFHFQIPPRRKLRLISILKWPFMFFIVGGISLATTMMGTELSAIIPVLSHPKLVNRFSDSAAESVKTTNLTEQASSILFARSISSIKGNAYKKGNESAEVAGSFPLTKMTQRRGQSVSDYDNLSVPLQDLDLPELLKNKVLKLYDDSEAEDSTYEDNAEAFLDDTVDNDENNRDHPNIPAEEEESRAEQLNPFSFRVASFQRGPDKNGKPIQASSTGEDLKLAGPPDYPLGKTIDAGSYISKLVMLGNRGTLVVEVVGGALMDKEGADFVIFTKPTTQFTGETRFVKKPAFVSVSEEMPTGPWIHFPCESGRGFGGCAGTTPSVYSGGYNFSNVGGDRFDLAEIGVQKVKYIRIDDADRSHSGDPEFDGIPLDSLALLHAEREGRKGLNL